MTNPNWARIDNPRNVQVPVEPPDDEPGGRPVPCPACAATGTDDFGRTCTVCFGFRTIIEHGGES